MHSSGCLDPLYGLLFVRKQVGVDRPRCGSRVLVFRPGLAFRPPPVAGLQAANIGEALQFLRKVIFVQDRVSSVLHHLQGHCPED